MLKHRIAQLLEEAVKQAQAQGLLPTVSLPEVVVEYPPDPQLGDYASSLALRLARASKLEPKALAEALTKLILPAPEVGQVTVAAPGYINFCLRGEWLAQQVDEILAQGERFGQVSLGQGQRLQLEFVSVNPTGPLHVGHGRGAVLGSTLARVLAASGYKVEREYYINDAGNQMDAFYHSCYARYLQALGKEATMPEAGYLGDYLIDLGRELAAELGQAPLALPEEQGIVQVGHRGMEKLLDSIRRDLETLRVTFDVWFSESSLMEGGQLQRILAMLRQGGYIEEREGALWFTSTALGDSRDNVLVRSSGIPTYFATDAAYHYNKFVERNFERVINIWGADHQGHVSRMKAVVGAL
ncbi:MAG: arginine--tRNA ligase, partial [Chloroflexota bacterium]